MKTKLLSMAFTMLTVCTMWSQDTIVDVARPDWFLKPVRSYSAPDTTDLRPISFPFWMVREIALDLEEKQQLELEAQLYALEVEAYQKLLESMEAQEQQRRLQLELLGRNISLVEAQLQAEKNSVKSTSKMQWYLRLLGALGVGFVLGRL